MRFLEKWKSSFHEICHGCLACAPNGNSNFKVKVQVQNCHTENLSFALACLWFKIPSANLSVWQKYTFGTKFACRQNSRWRPIRRLHSESPLNSGCNCILLLTWLVLFSGCNCILLLTWPILFSVKLSRLPWQIIGLFSGLSDSCSSVLALVLY